MSADDAAEVLAGWRAGDFSAEIAVMRLLTQLEDVERVAAAVAGVPPLAALFAANREGCARICAMLQSGVDPGGAPFASIDEGLAAVRRLFDWSVAEDEHASVALYSLGNPAILERATGEILALLGRWGLLVPRARVLELGCGTGRLVAPLAARVAQVTGIDVSSRMIEVATRRAADAPNASFRVVNGRDLADFADGSFELVLAVDSFPYVVQAGPALVATMFAEARRVLTPGGTFAILSYAYGHDAEGERAEVAAAARAAGLDVVVSGERPFALWDARGYRLAVPTPSSRR